MLSSIGPRQSHRVSGLGPVTMIFGRLGCALVLSRVVAINQESPSDIPVSNSTV